MLKFTMFDHFIPQKILMGQSMCNPGKSGNIQVEKWKYPGKSGNIQVKKWKYPGGKVEISREKWK